MGNLTFGALIRQDNGQGFRIRDDVIVIGRNYDCDIRIEKPYVSGVHAVICRENGHLVLEDLGGRHGTRVNGSPSAERSFPMETEFISAGRNWCSKPESKIFEIFLAVTKKPLSRLKDKSSERWR